jgi:hypothetical protein
LSSVHGSKWTFSAPKAIFDAEYLRLLALPQTTLCTVSDEITS